MYPSWPVTAAAGVMRSPCPPSSFFSRRVPGRALLGRLTLDAPGVVTRPCPPSSCRGGGRDLLMGENYDRQVWRGDETCGL